MKLLTKTDGFTQMVSAFVSCSLGVGLLLSSEELRQVNEKWASREWGKYISSKESIETGNNKKKPLEDQLTLIKYLDVGIKEEGHWNYNQMALQVEDVVDCLTIKYKNKYVDFLFLMDQSSGHGHMRDGTLNTNMMSVRDGWKQSNLRKNHKGHRYLQTDFEY